MLTDYFDGDVAQRYDAGSAAMFAPEVLGPTVDLLVDLAGGGAALELAIGTGRVALPLSERGVPVRGIELSEAMVEQLRAKPGGADLEVAVGDMTSTRVDGRFRLVYLVFNTIGNVTTQDGQVAVFQNAADHLDPGGCFLVETLVPVVRKMPPGERFSGFAHTDAHVGIDEYDVATQRTWSHHYSSSDGETYHRRSIPFRYTWPAELDLMARLAGMRLRDRWADWDRSPFTGESVKHVSVWQKADTPAS